MQTIGIIGAGNIGASLTHNLILYNKKVVLFDISLDALEKAKNVIKEDIRFSHMYLKKEKNYPASLIELVKFTTDINDLKNCSFIVENVTEDWAIKKDVYQQLDKICDSNVIFGVNTSCISITKIGNITSRPDKVVGMHFMNPVYLKSVVEVIKGFHTTQETIDLANNFLEAFGKTSVVVNDFPGFVSNRISHLFMNEAIFVLQDSVASVEKIDAIFKKCFGHKMGPLETADLIGLDTVYNSLLVLYDSYKDSKYRPAPLLEKMVNAGVLGVKTGGGFYKY